MSLRSEKKEASKRGTGRRNSRRLARVPTGKNKKKGGKRAERECREAIETQKHYVGKVAHPRESREKEKHNVLLREGRSR